MSWGQPSQKLLLEFEAKHGKVKRKVVKPKKPKLELTAEQMFAQAWESDPLPGVEMVREHVFMLTRKYRFDFAFPVPRVAVEIEGQGRHQTYVGFRADAEKYNHATLHGWRLLRFVAAEKKHVLEWVRLVKLALIGALDED